MTTGSTTEARFAAVLADGAVSDERAAGVADVLATATGQHRLDALGAVKRARWGTLLGNTTRDLAEHVAAEVTALGVRARVAPLAAVARFARRFPVLRGGCSKRGLHADPGHRGMRVFPWPSVRYAGVALHLKPREVRSTRKGRVRSGWIIDAALEARWSLAMTKEMVRWRNELQHSSRSISPEETFVLDLFLDPPGVTLRIDARRFNYSYLGQRLQERCELNFHALVCHVVEGAREARFAPAVGRLARGDLLEGFAFTDLDDFDLYNRWFILATEVFPC